VSLFKDAPNSLLNRLRTDLGSSNWKYVVILVDNYTTDPIGVAAYNSIREAMRTMVSADDTADLEPSSNPNLESGDPVQRLPGQARYDFRRSLCRRPQWISVDLGAICQVDTVRLQWESAYAKSYQIQLSLDGISWTLHFTTTTGAGGVEIRTFTPVSARYVRVYRTQRGTTSGRQRHHPVGGSECRQDNGQHL